MPRYPEIGSIQLYPQRPLRASDKNGFVLKFYCPIRCKRIRKNCGTRDRREARRVLRECRERLLNGSYIASYGAITKAQEMIIVSQPVQVLPLEPVEDRKTWDECYDRYRTHRASRTREKSLTDALSRINIAKQILIARLPQLVVNGELFVKDVMTLDHLEMLQERLLAGDECRYERRSTHTVNSQMGALMAFVRFCHKHGWIDQVPPLEKLSAEDAMRGRPVNEDEFQRMLKAVKEVVEKDLVEDWEFALKILWESGFRRSELLDLSWDDELKIHPRWGNDQSRPTIVVPSSQKNGRVQEIPMLPGLFDLLSTIPENRRSGPIVRLRLKSKDKEPASLDSIGRVIAKIGQKADIVVVKADPRKGSRIKYATAHDLRRGCAARLINSGISAETLKIVMRHADFDTTEKHYGAIRSAQAAAGELYDKLSV